MGFGAARSRSEASRSAKMLYRNVRIVGAAIGLGAPDPGCEAGPEALRRSAPLSSFARNTRKFFTGAGFAP